MPDENEKPPILYVSGEAGQLRIFTSPPRPLYDRAHGWPGAGYAFSVKYGQLAEWYTREPKPKRVYARVLPDDARAELKALDDEIAAVEAKRRELQRDRQSLLEAAAQRGERVRVPRP